MLKDGLVFEGPGLLDEAPSRVITDDRLRVVKVRLKIRAKTKAAARLGASRHCIQKISLNDPVFLVAEFRPGIRKKNEERRNPRGQRQSLHKEPRLGAEEVKVGQLGPVPFATGPLDAFTHQIKSDADAIGMRRRICGEKVTVSAADLTDKIRRYPEDWG